VNRKAFVVLLVGVVVAALAGVVVGLPVVAVLGLPAAYSRPFVVAVVVVAVAYSELYTERFDEVAYRADRGREGLAVDLVLAGAAGLVGGAVGTALSLALSLPVGFVIVVVFGLGFLLGMVPFVSRNRQYYRLESATHR